jgi:hypothetical protein
VVPALEDEESDEADDEEDQENDCLRHVGQVPQPSCSLNRALIEP